MTTETLTLREIRGTDIFPILDLIGKLDIVDEITGLFNPADAPQKPSVPREPATKAVKQAWDEYDAATDAYSSARGARIVGALGKAVLANARRLETDLNVLLGDLTDTDAATVGQLRAKEYMALVMSLVRHPDFIEVFTSAVESGTADDAA